MTGWTLSEALAAWRYVRSRYEGSTDNHLANVRQMRYRNEAEAPTHLRFGRGADPAA